MPFSKPIFRSYSIVSYGARPYVLGGFPQLDFIGRSVKKQVRWTS